MAKTENNIRIASWRDGQSAVGESFIGQISLTVPNQTLSIQQIIENHTRGITTIPEADLHYLDDSEIPNFETMSKIDQLSYASEIRHTVATRRKLYDDAILAGKKPAEIKKTDLSPKIETPESSLEDDEEKG